MKQIGEEELFNHMVENGFEFLKKAIHEFETDPNFSIVHFSTAIELFLKARLLKEHWSLVVNNSGSAKREEFFSGNSVTVNPQDAYLRLRHIACDSISEEAWAAFSQVIKLRNQMLHFGKSISHSEEHEKALLDRLVITQCKGWAQLNKLFKQDWEEYFYDFIEDISHIEFYMQRHKQYLTAKFDALRGEIESYTQSGSEIRLCASCGFVSAVKNPLSGDLSIAECLVCSSSVSVVSFECQNAKCSNVIEFDSYMGAPDCCDSCNTSIDKSLIINMLLAQDTEEGDTEINCPHCGSGGSVVYHGDGYICTNCYSYEELVQYCEWCNEGQLGGVSEFSYYSGCNFCSGRSGWKDD